MQTDYLIVGVGNTLRGDDGAGPALAERLAAALRESGARVQVRQVQQLLPELAAEVAELAPAALVIADCQAGAQASALRRLTGELAAQASGSHGLTPDYLLALAVRLYEFGGAGWLATVPGVDFAHGEGLSGGTQRAIAAAVPDIARQLMAQGAEQLAS